MWWMTLAALSVHNIMKMYFIHYGQVQTLHKYGMKTLNGVSEDKQPSKTSLNCSSTSLSQVVELRYLLCKFGRFGTEETKLEQPYLDFA